MEYTKAQEQAIMHKDGPMMVIAGPGSGKTAVLTRRVVHLIRDEHIPPSDLLVVTFTRRAAEEMKERCSAMDRLAGEVRIQTFHAAFYSILRSEQGNSMKMLEIDEAADMMHKQLAQWMRCTEAEARWRCGKLLSYYSIFRNTGRLPVPEEDETVYHALVQAYEKEKQKRHMLDFDDMAVQLMQLFDEKTEVLKKYQLKYTYICVDEFQDINGIQFQVLSTLAAGKKNLFVVGDDDQSIYGFRGSDPSYFLGFTTYYPEAVRVDLNSNFRSGSEIVSLSRRLIEHNKNRYHKDLQAVRKQHGHVTIHGCYNGYTQGSYIARTILKSKDIPWQEIAILTRVHAQQQIICEQLSVYGIAYEAAYVPSELELDILAYLTLALHPESYLSLKRIWNRPDRGLPLLPETYDQAQDVLSDLIRRYTRDPLVSLKMRELKYHLNRIRDLIPCDAIDYLWYVAGYKSQAERHQHSSGMTKADLKLQYQRLYQRARKRKTIEAFLQEPYQTDGKNAVHVMTMHESKGLEFRMVLIPDMNEGYMPHERSRSEEALEEERRLFYVAVTRARDRLCLSYVLQKTCRRKKSRYLDEILQHL